MQRKSPLAATVTRLPDGRVCRIVGLVVQPLGRRGEKDRAPCAEFVVREVGALWNTAGPGCETEGR